MTAGRRYRSAGLGLCLALILVFGELARASRPEPVHSETLYVFGTLVEVVLYGVPEDKARAATAKLDRLFRHLQRDWHAWKAGELGRVNAAIARGEPVEVSDEMAAVLRQGRALSAASGGLFEPAIGALIGLWGFHGDLPPTGPLPDAQTINRLVAAHPHMADLKIDGNRLRSANPAVQFDLGGYAKGAALDLAAKALEHEGIADAVLNAGGDLNVLGAHGAREWRVAIRDPFGWGAVAALSVHPGEVVYTSGNCERFFESGGERFSHILDPRTGWPVRDIVSATVLGTNGAAADAAATALSVAGPDRWAATAAAMGVDSALLIDRDGRFYATPEMAARMELVKPEGQGEATGVTIVTLAEPKVAR